MSPTDLNIPADSTNPTYPTSSSMIGGFYALTSWVYLKDGAGVLL
jgi:hypothetical protein